MSFLEIGKLIKMWWLLLVVVLVGLYFGFLSKPSKRKDMQKN